MAAFNLIEVETQVLGNRALPVLARRGWDVPSYARDGAPGVVHLGLGGFHRAHQAMVFDRLLRLGDPRWGVWAVGMRQHQLADSLRAQDGLYALGQSGPGGTSWALMGSIWRSAVAAREPELVRSVVAAPATRWVTLTVTEKGYGAELAGLLVDALSTRRERGLSGLTLASCDNQRGNGDTLRELCLGLARSRDASLADWITAACAFPNSMVDRIVPAPTDALRAQAGAALGLDDAAAVGTEGFWEWVIEDRFADPGDASALTRAGVRVVQDVRPYEDAKLRMLNGSHSAMACMGVVLGLKDVHQAVADPDLSRFLRGFINLDVGPGLERPDWPAYRDTLLDRFSNPALHHGLHQINSDASKKIPHRWVPAALDALRAGRMPLRLALAAAAWMRYLTGADESGQAYALNDPMADALQALATKHAGDPGTAAATLGALTDVWGAELPLHDAWMACVTDFRRRIDRVGLRAVLVALEHP